jgi:hypothetical protein
MRCRYGVSLSMQPQTVMIPRGRALHVGNSRIVSSAYILARLELSSQYPRAMRLDP